MLTYLTSAIFTCLFLAVPTTKGQNPFLPQSDVDLLEFPLNLEYLEAEFFLWGSLGYGLDQVEPNLTGGGPPPIGGKIANLDPRTRDIVLQFAYQEVGHLRAIKNTVNGFPRPLLDISADNFAKIINDALKQTLNPPPTCANRLNYLLASYIIPYVGLTGYVGANSKLQSAQAKRLVAGLLGVESAQDAVIRTLLYEQPLQKVKPYDITVADFTDRISKLRNTIGKQGLKDEGLIVPLELGAEGRISGNVIAGDRDSVAYDRSPEEVLRIVYGTGNESVPGGFLPQGGGGQIARSYLS
ncbi:Desiccation-related protein PCC13-62 [Rhynchospora pubera]|uniref:Desiccation-related protein PCC13-62 n=1 Tax=Rhynchospora pubera TaxID=906938 RepID=A0AAV8E040_9POAL|nr:Desiccation-related protein PCC13-62 [Rhynchospora pubera]